MAFFLGRQQNVHDCLCLLINEKSNVHLQDICNEFCHWNMYICSENDTIKCTSAFFSFQLTLAFSLFLLISFAFVIYVPFDLLCARIWWICCCYYCCCKLLPYTLETYKFSANHHIYFTVVSYNTTHICCSFPISIFFFRLCRLG